ncbi:hypothetical protein ILUMI_23190 [Ignelater luminosus]|uniref:Uncharacterized protein n=1 Tax=Ignelater luminosus TaxID=2038154 RepID=A0A8K0CCW6_IGNLU|nr:hypothetical protein ILUMI_23190 [Ignelater luminosus]
MLSPRLLHIFAFFLIVALETVLRVLRVIPQMFYFESLILGSQECCSNLRGSLLLQEHTKATNVEMSSKCMAQVLQFPLKLKVHHEQLVPFLAVHTTLAAKTAFGNLFL